jgi:formate hydrogenlyase subunit 3/multisubunit Na+/H+ antiporter MnhD subunit
MNEDRIQTFTEEIGELKLRGARADRERWLLILGGLGLIAGVGLAVFGGFQASGTTVLGDQIAFLATGTLIGLALVIAGAALFIRYSIARFMRFWLVRLVHEHRSETDRVIKALGDIEAKLKK